jgi:hypothetical protein
MVLEWGGVIEGGVGWGADVEVYEETIDFDVGRAGAARGAAVVEEG